MSLKAKAKRSFAPPLRPPVAPGASKIIEPEGKGSQYVGTQLESAGTMRHTPYARAQQAARRARR